MAKFLLLCNPTETSINGNQVPVDSYLPAFKKCCSGAEVYILKVPVTTLVEVQLYCQKRGITGVFTNQLATLRKLAGSDKPKISEYEGSYFNAAGLEWIIISPLAQLFTVPEGIFLTTRYCSKLIAPDSWPSVPDFTWKLLNANNIDSFVTKHIATSIAIATDIETTKDPLRIRCISWSAISLRDTGISIESGCLVIDSEWALAWMRRINAIAIPKIFQKGRYDLAYLQRFNAAPSHYFWDTSNMFHSWYSELDKSLDTLSAFFVRKARYWKDLANTQDLMEYYRYNCLDTYNTALVFLAWIDQAPAWARTNYLKEFPLQYACHLSELTGLKRDSYATNRQTAIYLERDKSVTRELAIITGTPNFNPGSPKQCLQLLNILGCGDIENSREPNLEKAAYRHPLNAFILGKILDIRGWRKLLSTYFIESVVLPGTQRILYSLNPDGTDTSRLSSREHPFWCGLNVQQIPRGPEVKCTVIADDGFLLAECDLSKAETWDTAYITGDENLIAALHSNKEFHSNNASKFFGLPYEQIYDDVKKKPINKEIRDLSKRTNHGANYVMGPDVMVTTMGQKNIATAKKLLKFPVGMVPIKVTEYLLERFHITYPGLHRYLYPWVKATVKATQMLTNPMGWTRFCFKDPIGNKRAFNSYVAHMPQSTNAQKLNVAYMLVFYEIAMNPIHRKNFKLHCQLHDAILFSFRIGHEYLAKMVQELMQIPVTVIGCDGVKRSYTVPADIKAGPDGKGVPRWSECE